MRLLYAREKHKPTWLGCWHCPNCDSEILLEEGDRVQQLSENRVKFTCPQCGQCPAYHPDPQDQKDAGQMFTYPCEIATQRCVDAKGRADRIP